MMSYHASSPTTRIPTASLHRPAPQAVLAGRVWEHDTIDYICAHCGDGDIVHAGTYFGDLLPAISRAITPGSRIWAFEPNPESFRYASVTLRINRLANVELANAGLGAVPECRGMHTMDDAGRPLGGSSRLFGAESAAPQGGDVQVDMVWINDMIPPDRRVSIIQLDEERFERQALTGALATIKRCKPILILESLPEPQWPRQPVGAGLSSLGQGPRQYDTHCRIALRTRLALPPTS